MSFIVSNFDPDNLSDPDISEDEQYEYEFSSEEDAEEAAQALSNTSEYEKWFVWESDDSLRDDVEEIEDIEGDDNEYDSNDLDEDEEEDI